MGWRKNNRGKEGRKRSNSTVFEKDIEEQAYCFMSLLKYVCTFRMCACMLAYICVYCGHMRNLIGEEGAQNELKEKMRGRSEIDVVLT